MLATCGMEFRFRHWSFLPRKIMETNMALFFVQVCWCLNFHRMKFEDLLKSLGFWIKMRFQRTLIF